MHERKGVILVSFDLPTDTKANRTAYRTFRSYLKKHGYIMFQESLYLKIIKSTINTDKEIKELKNNSPKIGDIIALPLTTKEIAKIKTIIGKGIDIDYITEDVFFY